MTTNNRRKALRVVHYLQLKYTLSLLLPFLFILLIVELQMYYMIKMLITHVEFLSVKGDIIKSIIIIMIEVFVLLVIAGIFNIIYLHRIAGPINRLINEINKMVETDKYHLLVVRKSDELGGLVNSFNSVIKKLMNE